jgi:thioredoxin 1
MVTKVTDENYSGFIDSGIVVLNFKAEWCGPCRALSPIIDELSNNYENVRVGRVNIDENPNIVESLGIRSVPTTIIYKNGEIIEKHVGNASILLFKSLIDKHN